MLRPTTPTTFEFVRSRRHNSQRPSVLRHLSSIHWTHTLTFSGKTLCVCLGSRRRHTGDFTRCPSDGETDAAVARLLFGQSLSSGYGVGSPDRLFAFRTTPNASVRGLCSFLELCPQDQAGLDCWIYLIRLRETGHFE